MTKNNKPQEITPEQREILNNIGAKIKDLRKENGFSNYKEFAQKVGIATYSYQRIENGLGNFTILMLIRVMSQFPDKKLSDLLKEVGL
jgi:transcriptional regulator with XRE-family HTH domain